MLTHNIDGLVFHMDKQNNLLDERQKKRSSYFVYDFLFPISNDWREYKITALIAIS